MPQTALGWIIVAYIFWAIGPVGRAIVYFLGYLFCLFCVLILWKLGVLGNATFLPWELIKVFANLVYVVFTMPFP